MSSAFTITIDGRSVVVRQGDSILGAARKLGIDIPTLCYLEKCGPLNTCQVCLVKVDGRLVPSCGTKAVPGMVVESETEEVHEARRTALELLSAIMWRLPGAVSSVVSVDAEHTRHAQAYRRGPAQRGQQYHETGVAAGGRVGAAVSSIRVSQGCRRGNWDSPAAIRDMERFVADREREDSSLAMLPPNKASTGKSVVIIGAGPAGLSAAFCLRREGHAITIVANRTNLETAVLIGMDQCSILQL